MMSEVLDLSSFRNALSELERMYAYACSPKVRLEDPQLFDYMRTAVIQGFEYVYEASHKSIRRFFDMYGPTKETDDEYVFPTLIRLAKEYGLIDDVAVWMMFREKRNMTSHTYERAKADQVFAIIPQFLLHTRFLLESLERQVKAAT